MANPRAAEDERDGAGEFKAAVSAEDLKSPATVEFMGVRLEKGTGAEEHVPTPYENFIEDALTLEMEKKLAIAWSLHQPALVEGGTQLGKSTIVREMAAQAEYSFHYMNFNGLTDAEDMMGSPMSNMDRKSELDPEFVFLPGPVTAALKEAASGNKVVLVLDEYNSGAARMLIRMHEVLDQIEKSGEVVLNEGGSERLKVVRENINVVALTNPPSRGSSQYAEREPLDVAQMRRWVYLKMPDEMPEGSLTHFTKAMFGLAPRRVEGHGIADMVTPEEALTTDELQSIPGLEEIIPKYLEFHKAAKELLLTRHIGQDQPQPFSFNDREEPRRIREFLARFYDGNLTETFQAALTYYYVNKLADPADRAQLATLIETVEYVPPDDDRRINVPASAPAAPPPFPPPPMPETAPAPPEEARQLVELSDLLNRGARKQDVMEGLAGMDSDLAWNLRERLAQEPGMNTAYGRGLAGVNSLRAWSARDDMVANSRWTRLASSLVGLNTAEAWVYRRKIYDSGNRSDLRALAQSLAGLDTAQAWAYRNDDKMKAALEGDSIQTAQSLIGLKGDEAWQWRQSMLTAGTSDSLQRLGESLAGMDNDTAWQMRRALIAQGADDAMLRSLAGIDTAAAHEERMEVGRDTLPNFPRSLSGTTSGNSRQARRLPAAVSSLEREVESINGNWVLAGVRAARQANP